MTGHCSLHGDTLVNGICPTCRRYEAADARAEEQREWTRVGMAVQLRREAARAKEKSR